MIFFENCSNFYSLKPYPVIKGKKRKEKGKKIKRKTNPNLRNPQPPCHVHLRPSRPSMRRRYPVRPSPHQRSPNQRPLCSLSPPRHPGRLATSFFFPFAFVWTSEKGERERASERKRLREMKQQWRHGLAAAGTARGMACKGIGLFFD